MSRTSTTTTIKCADGGEVMPLDALARAAMLAAAQIGVFEDTLGGKARLLAQLEPSIITYDLHDPPPSTGTELPQEGAVLEGKHGVVRVVYAESLGRIAGTADWPLFVVEAVRAAGLVDDSVIVVYRRDGGSGGLAWMPGDRFVASFPNAHIEVPNG